MLKSLLEALMAAGGLPYLIGGVLIVALLAWRFLKRGTDGQKEREAVLHAGIEFVVKFGKPLAEATPNKIDDAIVAALDMLDDYLEQHGEPPVDADEAAKARAAFEAAVQ